MSRDSTVIPFRQPDAIDDPLTELAREGARRMLARALIVEADAFVAQWKDLKLPDGRDRVVRHGHGPQRTIQTGSGLSRSDAPRYATGARQARRKKSASLVLIGATPEGKKELVGFQTGVRESAQSWGELLIDIKQRGLEIAPDLAVSDGRCFKGIRRPSPYPASTVFGP